MQGLLARTAQCLSSIRFTRGFLVAIGFLALVGTLIPQQEEPATYLVRFGPLGGWWSWDSK